MTVKAVPAATHLGRQTKDVGSNTYLGPEGPWDIDLTRIFFLTIFFNLILICTFEVVEVVPEVDSALPKGILTNSLPGVFSTTRFMATPSVACRTFPLPTDIRNSCHVQHIPEGTTNISKTTNKSQPQYLWVGHGLGLTVSPPFAFWEDVSHGGKDFHVR